MSLRRLTLTCLVSLLPFFLHTQPQPIWRSLPTAPNVGGSRIDDAVFLSPTRGWIANGFGQIWKTTDGGGTWAQQFNNNTIYFRCLTFADSLRGWACNLGTEEFGGATDTNIIYQTTNGGLSWFANDNIFPGKPRGLCGITTIADSFVYAVGRVRGPAFFVRSTDGGNTWERRDMSAFAMGLLDCYFFTPDSGIAVGHTGPVNSSSSGVVLFTSDRGNTWQIRYTTSRLGEWCWKINFPTRQVGYVSLQRNSGAPVTFLKTTDGGVTWVEKQFLATAYYVQGIGFASTTKGWIGGNSSLPTYATTDGGDTWFQEPFGVRVNRFRMFNDTLGYAVGQTVYKYSRQLPTDVPEHPLLPESFVLLSVYPNPFNPQTTIEYAIRGGVEDPATPFRIRLLVYDLLGREVQTLVNDERREGTFRVQFDGSNLASGMYVVRLVAAPGLNPGPTVSGRFETSQKLLLLR